MMRQYSVPDPGGTRLADPGLCVLVLLSRGGADADRMAGRTGTNRLPDRESFIALHPASRGERLADLCARRHAHGWPYMPWLNKH
jgi:poly(3-hydroxybutyrate) depolymerase